MEPLQHMGLEGIHVTSKRSGPDSAPAPWPGLAHHSLRLSVSVCTAYVKSVTIRHASGTDSSYSRAWAVGRRDL